MNAAVAYYVVHAFDGAEAAPPQRGVRSRRSRRRVLATLFSIFS
jgi:hypothetical protein